MATYRARVEVRQRGAIGLFRWTTLETEALNEVDAYTVIVGKVESSDLERRGFCMRKMVEGVPVEPFPQECFQNDLGTLFEQLDRR